MTFNVRNYVINYVRIQLTHKSNMVKRVMFKDNFYYILRDRLDYANHYLVDTAAYLKSIEFAEKVRREFYKDKFFLFIIISLINLPSEILRKARFYKSIFDYSRAEKEIEVLKRELKKYEKYKKS